MDSITHIVLGAGIGELVAGKQLGKKAMLWGAIAQSLPDIDFINSFWMDTSHDVLAHRGITHSFFFAAIVAPMLALLCNRLYPGRMALRKWTLFLGMEMVIHLVLDAFNAYGTGWFEPFSHYRVSFHTLFVADPLFSIWPGLAFCALLIMKRDHPRRRLWAGWGLLLCCAYLLCCLINKVNIDRRVDEELRRQGIVASRYFTTPTMMNSLLWYIVAEDREGYHIGYRSVFDGDEPIHFDYFPRNDSLLDPFRKKDDVHRLIRFSQGYYTVDSWEQELVFNDLRFGLIRGWEGGQHRFVFHYFLQNPAGNLIIVQRGRLAGWNRRTIRSFLRRISGVQPVPKSL